VICRVEVDTAEETLGIFLAPSGSMDGEIEKLKRKVADWIQHLASGKLTRLEMWTAYGALLHIRCRLSIYHVNNGKKSCPPF
jgi:hypothetical protein